MGRSGCWLQGRRRACTHADLCDSLGQFGSTGHPPDSGHPSLCLQRPRTHDAPPSATLPHPLLLTTPPGESNVCRPPSRYTVPPRGPAPFTLATPPTSQLCATIAYHPVTTPLPPLFPPFFTGPSLKGMSRCPGGCAAGSRIADCVQMRLAKKGMQVTFGP